MILSKTKCNAYVCVCSMAEAVVIAASKVCRLQGRLRHLDSEISRLEHRQKLEAGEHLGARVYDFLNGTCEIDAVKGWVKCFSQTIAQQVMSRPDFAGVDMMTKWLEVGEIELKVFGFGLEMQEGTCRVADFATTRGNRMRDIFTVCGEVVGIAAKLSGPRYRAVLDELRESHVELCRRFGEGFCGLVNTVTSLQTEVMQKADTLLQQKRELQDELRAATDEFNVACVAANLPRSPTGTFNADLMTLLTAGIEQQPADDYTFVPNTR